MSGRLVGEVAEWLRSPAAADLSLAERTVLLIIAERANEKTREMWRHRGDDATLFERICQVTGMDRSGLTKVLKRLAGREIEVRVQLGETNTGAPVFAHRGTAMRFFLPALPASVALPERVDERGGIPPADDPADSPPEAPPATPKGWTYGHPWTRLGPRTGTQTGRKGPRAGTPNTSKELPSKELPSTRGSPPYGAEAEDTPPPAVTPAGDPGTHHHLGYEPIYLEASKFLQTHPDFGDRFMAQAATELPAGTSVAYRVIHAAQLARQEAIAS